MNLSAYDNVVNKINKRKTWINSRNKSIISREISYRKYYTFVKRYEPKLNDTIYFIVMLDNIDKNRKISVTRKDDYGRVCLKINSIIDKLELNINKDSSINIKHIEHTFDGDIYEIEV